MDPRNQDSAYEWPGKRAGYTKPSQPKPGTPMGTSPGTARPSSVAGATGTPPEGPTAPQKPPGQPVSSQRPVKPASPRRPGAPGRIPPAIEGIMPRKQSVGAGVEVEGPQKGQFSMGDVYKALVYSRTPSATPETRAWSASVLDWYGKVMRAVQTPPGQAKKQAGQGRGRQPTEPRGAGQGLGGYKTVTKTPGRSAMAPGQVKKAAQSTYYNDPRLQSAPWKRNQMMQRGDYQRGGAAPGAVKTTYGKGQYNPNIGGSLFDPKDFLRLMMKQMSQSRPPYKTY